MSSCEVQGDKDRKKKRKKLERQGERERERENLFIIARHIRCSLYWSVISANVITTHTILSTLEGQTKKCMYRPLESSVSLSWLQVLWAWIEVVTPSAPFPGFSRFLAFFFFFFTPTSTFVMMSMIVWLAPIELHCQSTYCERMSCCCVTGGKKKTHLCRRACFCCHPTRFVRNGAPLALLASSCCGSELDCLLVVYIPLPACSIFKLTGNVSNCGYLFW